MTAPMCTLVLSVLTIESSYAKKVERAATVTPDTIQFWLTSSSQWRIRTYAVDHDIHTHKLGVRPDGSSLTPEEAVAHLAKHYGDVTLKTVVLRFRDPTDNGEVCRAMEGHGLAGVLECGKDGVTFYNPDKAEYRTKSNPK